MGQDDLSLREKIGQLFMIGFPGQELPPESEQFIQAYNIGFIILFSRNIGSITQTAGLTNHIHTLGKISPAIFVDQEGGLVVRFGESAATVISAMGLSATQNPGNARLAGKIIGTEMGAIGFDGVFAPVLDVNVNADNPVIGSRSFSDDPNIVTAFGSAFADGLQESGVAACGKHFPGHGSTDKDSHLDLPQASVAADDFSHYCLAPFLRLAEQDIASLMTAHVVFPHQDSRLATFSPYFIREILKTGHRYQGVVFSDCLEMKAIKDNYTVDQIVTQAGQAGIDVLIASHTLAFQKQLIDRLIAQVEAGVIPVATIDEAFARVCRLKEKLGSMKKKRKSVDPDQANRQARSSIALELDLARQSITLVRNQADLLPLATDKRILILECVKEISGPDVIDDKRAPASSALYRIGRRYCPYLEYRAIAPGLGLSPAVKQMLAEKETVIVCTSTRNPAEEIAQAGVVAQVLAERPDVIVAALGNPYDIRRFPGIDTYIVTYGARNVQLEALFEVLSGACPPGGRLPVEIPGFFPRGHGLTFRP